MVTSSKPTAAQWKHSWLPSRERVSEEPTDEELMSAYVGGDDAAFRTLYERYAGPLTRAVYARVGNQDVARDIVQDAFVRFHNARNDFKVGARVRPWLYTIAFNRARDWGRKKGRRTYVEYEDRDFPVMPTDEVVRQEDIQRIRDALDELSPKHREVIDLHWFEGLSFPEISQITGDGVSALKVRAHRTYKKLRSLLGTE